MEPLRPSDYDDGSAPERTAERPDRASGDGPTQPRLGVVGWARFLWRQLTSMRTALVLLLLLAVAAIPGSLVPQRSSNPNGVVQFRRDDPELFEILDTLQLFDTFTSVWFSAIYLLLFVSLIGCIIPRTAHHWKALRSRPPKTPARLNRLVGYREADAPTTVADALTAGEAVLRRQRYRVERYGNSLSAERGYLRETGNLVFHVALIGVLGTVGLAGGFGYNGQKVIVEGQTFVNQLTTYDSFSASRFFSDARLDPFSMRLDEFDAVFGVDETTLAPQPLDYTATVTITENGESVQRDIKVNAPIDIAGVRAYLLGNGFAPVITIRNADGQVVFDESVAFLPQDGNLTSLGIIKVPDGLPEQVGMIGFFYPSAIQLASGALTSIYPQPDNPVLTLNVFVGDLGLDDGVPRNAYALDVDELEQITGGETGVDSIILGLGQSAELPNGYGTVEFTALPRFVSIDFHHDPTQLGVLVSSVLAIAGLLVSLFVPRRRVWIAVDEAADGAGVRLQYAGLARGDDPNLDDAVERLVAEHLEAVGGTRAPDDAPAAAPASSQ
ncbi:cytochrome c biogenesis protein ResB [Microcella sp.]|uniref:cytochrome c biogenesis protein ResB n=1 Tax=Microcella sp. TaxID=1913979 RepID=UPI00391D399E